MLLLQSLKEQKNVGCKGRGAVTAGTDMEWGLEREGLPSL